MLDLGKVVLGVLVQDDLAYFLEREFFVRPDFGEVED